MSNYVPGDIIYSTNQVPETPDLKMGFKKVNLLEITVQTDIRVLLCTCCINNLSKATGKEKSILYIFFLTSIYLLLKKITCFCVCYPHHIQGFLQAGKIKQALAGFNQLNPALLNSDWAFDKA